MPINYARSIEGMKNTLEAPAEEPADGEPACTVQVKLPSGKRCVRKFAKAGQLRQVAESGRRPSAAAS